MKFSIRSFVTIVFFLFPLFVFADVSGYTYSALQPIQRPGGGKLYDTNILQYLANIYTFAIAIAGGLAVIRIVYAGIKYMTSDAFSLKTEAKKEIWAAIIGLVMALGSYVFLYTLNPKLVVFNLNIKPTNQIVGDGRGLFLSINGTLLPRGTNGTGGGYIGGGSSGGTEGNNSKIVDNGDGTYSLTTSDLALDTDGSYDPGIDPETHKSETSYHVNGKPLNSDTDLYVVVPDNSPIQLGTNVIITNPTTGQQVTAIVGDHGGYRGYGEVSIGVSKAFGFFQNKDVIGGTLKFDYTNKK